MKESYKILVVDDEPGIRDFIVWHLEDDFECDYELDVHEAEDGLDAYEKLQKEEFDLVISDIKMPKMNGIELIQKISSEFPKVKTVLMTAFNIDDYLKMVRDYKVSNILVKTAPFDLKELETVVDNVLTERNVFGIKNYLEKSVIIEEKVNTLSTDNADSVIESLVNFASKDSQIDLEKFQNVLNHAIPTLFHYALRDEFGNCCHNLNDVVSDTKGCSFSFDIGADNKQLAVAIKENQGMFSKEYILDWLEERLNENNSSVIRNGTERLIINIKKAEKSEIILVFYNERTRYYGNKPLYINEI